MKSQIKVLFSFLLVSALSGCIDISGGTETGSESLPNLNNTDFVVETPANGDSNTGQTTPDDSLPQPTDQNDIPGAPQIVRGLIINNDAKVVGSRDLQIKFDPPFTAGFLKLSNNEYCGDGSWVDYIEDTNATASSGGLIYYSVKFRDFDGRESRCYFRSIQIDEVGPEILFSQYPASAVEEGNDVEIVYSVRDAMSDIRSVTCEFAGVQKPCVAGPSKVTFPGMAAGDYVFKVYAEDVFGHKSEKAIGFKVTSLYKRMAQDVNVKANKKVDILFVVDNSGSMEFEQRSMASRVRNFLDVVQGLDWQIGVTTTDPSNKVSWGDGQLVQFSKLFNTPVINSTMDPIKARDALSATLQRSELGSGVEQGINATYRAIERAQSSHNNNSKLIRPDAQLAVVVISDEDESANKFKNDPSNLINYIQTTYKGQKAFSFHSIIARPGDKACLAADGYTEGFRYEALSKLTGGVIGDVCASDYAAQVQGVAEGVRATLKTITLSCEPIIDSLRTFKVIKDGVPYTANYTVNGVNVIFDDMLAEGSYKFEYSCVR
ncbi:MAG: vWA domain-containing protein [Bdellovibrionia bacterium]